MPTDKPVLTPAEAAALLGCHVDTLRRWTDEGHIPHHRTFGGQRRYKRADIDAITVPFDGGEPEAASA